MSGAAPLPQVAPQVTGLQVTAPTFAAAKVKRLMKLDPKLHGAYAAQLHGALSAAPRPVLLSSFAHTELGTRREAPRRYRPDRRQSDGTCFPHHMYCLATIRLAVRAAGAFHRPHRAGRVETAHPNEKAEVRSASVFGKVVALPPMFRSRGPCAHAEETASMRYATGYSKRRQGAPEHGVPTRCYHLAS